MRELVRQAGVDRTKVLPPKNLVGMPWRVAFALQRDGWVLRNGIVWHKPNAMPESVRDRLSTRYEMLYLLTKQRRYWFDLDPIREPLARPEALHEQIRIGGMSKGSHPGIGSSRRRHGRSIYRTRQAKYSATFPGHRHGTAIRATGKKHTSAHPRGRNPGDVWSISTRPLRAAHFAAFPIDIPLRCIAAGCPPDGVALDPFSGAGTTGLAALQLGRTYIGIDLNPDFHAIALDRMNDTRASGRTRGATVKPHVEHDYRVWWHSGLRAWAWLCWRCRAGTPWSGHEPSWRQAHKALRHHIAVEHAPSLQLVSLRRLHGQLDCVGVSSVDEPVHVQDERVRC